MCGRVSPLMNCARMFCCSRRGYTPADLEGLNGAFLASLSARSLLRVLVRDPSVVQPIGKNNASTSRGRQPARLTPRTRWMRFARMLQSTGHLVQPVRNRSGYFCHAGRLQRLPSPSHAGWLTESSRLPKRPLASSSQIVRLISSRLREGKSFVISLIRGHLYRIMNRYGSHATLLCRRDTVTPLCRREAIERKKWNHLD